MLKLEKRKHLAIITIDRPKVLNALSVELLERLESALIEVEKDREIRVLIITGSGRSFVAGADIAEMSKLDLESARQFALFGQRVFNHLEYMEIPTIAAVNGFAFGGGMELALACDLRVASPQAEFGQLEVTLGIMTGFAGSQRLPRLIGLGKAKEYIFTADRIKAEEALAVGLVNHLADNALDKAIEVAEKIIKQAPVAIRYSKQAIFATEDQNRGMQAFLKKEKAVFEGN